MAETPVAAPKKKRSISSDLAASFGGAAAGKAQGQVSALSGQLSTAQQAQKDLIAQEITTSGSQEDRRRAKRSRERAVSKGERGISRLQASLSGQQAIVDDPLRAADAKTRDIISGAQFGETVLGEEGLGRSTDSADVNQAMSQLREQSQGFSGAEALARREQAVGNLNQANQGQQRALQAQLARAGVRGGQAGAQVRDTAIAGLQQRGNLERDLFLQGEEAKRTGTAAFAQAAGEQSKFDIGQASKEKNIVLQSGLGFAQLGAAERGAKIQAEATKAAAASQAAASGGGGMSVVCTELNRQGILSDAMYKVNTEWGMNLIANEPESFSAYLVWGLPTARLMKKSKLATKILAPFHMSWIKHINGDKGVIGTVVFNTLFPATQLLGKVMKFCSKLKRSLSC